MFVAYPVKKKPEIFCWRYLAECLPVLCSICRISNSLEFPPHLFLTFRFLIFSVLLNENQFQETRIIKT